MRPLPILRREHLRALAAGLRERYERNMIAYLRQAFPAWCGDRPDIDLLEFVRASARRAERYRITTEGGAATFCELEVRFGVGFEKHEEPPGMLPVLKDAGLPGHAKAEWLLRELTESPPPWASAARAPGPEGVPSV